MRGRGRPRRGSVATKGPPIKVMMNMQAATTYNYSYNYSYMQQQQQQQTRPRAGRRGRGRPRGSRSRGLGRDTIRLSQADEARGSELQTLELHHHAPLATTKRKKSLHTDDVAPPVVKRRRKELKLESDDEFSDVDIDTLIPQSYHKDSSEDQHSQVEKCRLCDKPAVDSTCLSTCTTTTKIQMYQKLDKIVSADHLTLKQKKGVLCSRCSRLLNYIDRIEVELSMLKKTIVECIHKKHNLYVPDESLNFEVVSGEEAQVEEDYADLQENRFMEENQTVSYTKQYGGHTKIKQYTDIHTKTKSYADKTKTKQQTKTKQYEDNQTKTKQYTNTQKNSKTFWDSETESQVSDSYFFEEHVIGEAPHEVETDLAENGDVDMCEEYLEPMFDETLVSNREEEEEEATTDVHQSQEQLITGEDRVQPTAGIKMKPFTTLQKQNKASDDLGKSNLHDDLDVRMLIEELTTDTNDEDEGKGQNAEQQSIEMEVCENSNVKVRSGHKKEPCRDSSAVRMEARVSLSKSAELTDCKISEKTSEEFGRKKPEENQDQECGNNIGGRVTPDVKDWEIIDTDVQNKEVTGHQSKIICYNADEWEDVDSQSLDKDVTVKDEEVSENDTEQISEINVEVIKQMKKDLCTVSQGDVNSEKIQSDDKETEALTMVKILPQATSEQHQAEKDPERQLEKMGLEMYEEKKEDKIGLQLENDNGFGKNNETLKKTSENNYEANQEVSEIDVHYNRKSSQIDDLLKEENYGVNKENGGNLNNVSNETDVDIDGDKMDTCDEDEKTSAEIKWSSDSDTGDTESSDEEVTSINIQDKVTDDDGHTTAEDSVAETQGNCQEEDVNKFNDVGICYSTPIKVSDEALCKESIKPLKDIDSLQENAGDCVQQKTFETLLQEHETDMEVQEDQRDVEMEETEMDAHKENVSDNDSEQQKTTEIFFKKNETDSGVQENEIGFHKENSLDDSDPQQESSESVFQEGVTDFHKEKASDYVDVQQKEVEIGVSFASNINLEVQANESDTIRDDSSNYMEGQVQEEDPNSNSFVLSTKTETEINFSNVEEKEGNIDEKQEDKTFSEESEEQIKKEKLKVNSETDDDQPASQMLAEEGDPEIEVLKYSKTEESGSVHSMHSNSFAVTSNVTQNQGTDSSGDMPREKPIADMLEEHLASILAEEPLSGEQGELFSMDVDSMSVTEKSSGSLPGSNSIVSLQTQESVIRMLEEPVASTQGNELFADVSDAKSVIIIDEDEEADSSQTAMLARMGLIGQPEHALSDLCGTTSDVECVDISSD